ncbi:MAG: acyltransferase [Salinibacterium sp.]|nr:acyltransferase [Salinibacterium sp.]
MEVGAREPLRRQRVTRSAVRPEIQALRAIAVMAVVLYHLWPLRVTGGFVGVDVFFVISGYLIIGHLLRESDRSDRISLVSFWARRARRLLPASLLVLVATGVAIAIWVPQVLWREWFLDIAASAVYGENWLLAANAVDYLGADNAASPVQHFWSLSVEEQFYIVWPILIVVALAVSRARLRRYRRHIIVGLLVILTVSSFVYSVYEVNSNASAAYFVTQGRAWEFGAGGLLATLASAELRGREHLKSAASWAGLMCITGAIFGYTPQTAFPGIAALLPVIGTGLVIWARVPETNWSPGALLSLRPVTWVGDISYSLYLWHWPPIVLLPYILEHGLSLRTRIVILLLAAVAAWLTKKFVEDPVRTSQFLVSRRPVTSLAICLAATIVVVGGSATGIGTANLAVAQASAAMSAAVNSASKCVGAPATLSTSNCNRPFVVTTLTDPAFARSDIGRGVQVTDPCKQTIEGSAVMTCIVGATSSPRTTIALLGDSHAGQFLVALDAYGQKHGIRFITYLKSVCVGTGAMGVSSLTFANAQAMTSCTEWGRDALKAIESNSAITAVVFTNYTSLYLGAAVEGARRPLESSDFTTAWAPLLAAGKKVIVVRDTPAAVQNAPQCVAEHPGDYDPCSTVRASAQLAVDADPMLEAAKATPAGELVDLSSTFCGIETCHVVIGGLIVYFDDAHLTATFSKTLAPIIGAHIERAIASH